MRNLRLKPYSEQKSRWPSQNKALLAQFDADTVVVYQAYRPRIGRIAAETGRFGTGFKLERMSWIKPGFLWMMHRCVWGTSPDQETVLAIWIQRAAFDTILSRAVRSSFHPALHATQEDWQRDLKQSEVHVQWDPDWDARDIKLKRRVIQLGLSGETLRCYAQEWIVEIQDISALVREQSQFRRDPELLLTPVEKPYALNNPELSRRLGIGVEDGGEIGRWDMKSRPELLPSIALIGVIVLAALAIVQPFAPQPPEPNPGPMTVSGGDYDGLSLAVSRFFGARALPSNYGGRSELRVGDLPPDLQFRIYVPPGTTIVGSLEGDMPGEVLVALDSNASLEDLFSGYEASLTGQGFVESEPGRMFSIGAEAPLDGWRGGTFCRSRDSVVINLNIRRTPDGPTAVSLYANTDARFNSCLATDPSGVIGVGYKILPSIKTPVGSVVRDSGSGGGRDDTGYAYNRAEIEFPISAEKLADYIHPQLRDAGWVMTGSSTSEYGAWSTWLVKDAEDHSWDGALVIVASPASNRISIRLEVRRLP